MPFLLSKADETKAGEKMKYSIKIWNNDEFIQEIELNGKKYSYKLLTEAKRMCKWFKEYGQEKFTCIDLCKNGDAWINLISKAV